MSVPAGEGLTMLCTLGLAGVMAELGPRFEQALKRPLSVRLGPTAALAADIEAGTSFDVAVLTAPAIAAFAKAGAIVADSGIDIARSCVGVTVTPGLPEPDIASVDAFRRALLSARRVCYTSSGASGKHFASLLPRLGLVADMERKALVIEGLVAERVMRGEADLGIQQISEIRAVPGSVLVGPIPEELQAYTVFAAGLGAHARDPAAAATLLRLLADETTLAVAYSKGLDPV